MDTKQAIALMNALVTVGEAVDMKYSEVAQMICLLDSDKLDIFNEAIRLRNEFDNASIPDRGRLLGLNIQEDPDGSFVATCVLSEREMDAPG